ncbi:MAG: hypothetical protein ACOYOP_01310 [Microthrixaceae bacterium]
MPAGSIAAPTAAPTAAPAAAGRGEDRAATLRQLIDSVRPVTAAHERTLPVLAALEPLLPAGGLVRGSSVRVAGGPGATSLALAVLAGPTRAGSWAACVGLPALGWSAAAEVGVALERVAVVEPGTGSWSAVTAALLDAFDVVLCGPAHRPSAADLRRLSARARERGSVLVGVEAGVRHGGDRRDGNRGADGWPADVRLGTDAAVWDGMGDGHGHLRSRRLTVVATGRGHLARPRRVDLWIPGAEGRPAPAGDEVDHGRHPADGVGVAPVVRLPARPAG